MPPDEHNENISPISFLFMLVLFQDQQRKKNETTEYKKRFLFICLSKKQPLYRIGRYGNKNTVLIQINLFGLNFRMFRFGLIFFFFFQNYFILK